MNKQDITTRYLHSYKFYQERIKTLQEQLTKLAEDMTELSSVDYSKDRISGTPTGDMLNTLLTEKIYLEQSIRYLTTIIKSIDRGVELLPLLQHRIIELRFISPEGYTWEEIAEQVGIKGINRESVIRNLHREKKKALKTLSAMFVKP